MACGRFANLDAARSWVRDFIRWYNYQPPQSYPLRDPAQRHRGEDKEVLARCHVLYQQTRNQHPRRWSGATRNWQPIGVVTLNPERELPVLKIAA